MKLHSKLLLTVASLSLILAACSDDKDNTKDNDKDKVETTDEKDKAVSKDNTKDNEEKGDTVTDEIEAGNMSYNLYTSTHMYEEKDLSKDTVLGISSLLLTGVSYQFDLESYKSTLEKTIKALDKDSDADIIKIAESSLKLIEGIEKGEDLEKYQNELVTLINTVIDDAFKNLMVTKYGMSEEEFKVYKEFVSTISLNQGLSDLSTYSSLALYGSEADIADYKKRLDAIAKNVEALPSTENELVEAYKKLYKTVVGEESTKLIQEFVKTEHTNEEVKAIKGSNLVEEVYNKPYREFMEILNKYERNGEFYTIKRFEIESMRAYMPMKNVPTAETTK